MKKLIGAATVILFLFIFLRECDDRPDHVKLVHRIMQNITVKLEHQFPLRYIGRSVSANENYYKEIGLMFQIFRVISKDEGRKILIDAVEDLLEQLNAAPLLKEHLQPYPFTAANIEIDVFSYHPNGEDTFYPDITVFSARKGTLRFVADTPETRSHHLHYTEETESYEEAVKIVNQHSSQ